MNDELSLDLMTLKKNDSDFYKDLFSKYKKSELSLHIEIVKYTKKQNETYLVINIEW